MFTFRSPSTEDYKLNKAVTVVNPENALTRHLQYSLHQEQQLLTQVKQQEPVLICKAMGIATPRQPFSAPRVDGAWAVKVASTSCF